LALAEVLNQVQDDNGGGFRTTIVEVSTFFG
jgi:hypothetical protein